MFKTRLDTFGNDFGHFWIFETFLIFLKIFEDSTVHGTLGKKFFRKNSKFQKCPKSFPKVSKRVLNMFLGCFFSKTKLLPSVPWRVDSSKIFKKIKKFSKILKCPKSFPKMSKRVLNMFWGNFFERIFCPVFHGRSSLRKFSKKSKKFQKSKNAQNRSQKCPNVF